MLANLYIRPFGTGAEVRLFVLPLPLIREIVRSGKAPVWPQHRMRRLRVRSAGFA